MITAFSIHRPSPHTTNKFEPTSALGIVESFGPS